MAMAGMRWYKVSSSILDDTKIKIIKRMPNGRVILLIWFELLTLASKEFCDGHFAFEGGTPVTDEMIAVSIDEPIGDVRFALKTFEQFHMVEWLEDTLFICNWAKYQEADRYERMKKQTAVRVRRYRDAMKKGKTPKIQGRNENVTLHETLPSRYVTQLEVEEEIEIEKEKDITTTTYSPPPPKDEKSKQEKPVAVVAKTPLFLVKDFSGDNAELLDSLKAWIEMRQKMKRPLTGRATVQALRKLNELAAGNQDAMIRIVDQSTMKGWLTFYQLKDGRGNANALADVAKRVDDVIPDTSENPEEVKAWLAEEGLL